MQGKGVELSTRMLIIYKEDRGAMRVVGHLCTLNTPGKFSSYPQSGQSSQLHRVPSMPNILVRNVFFSCLVVCLILRQCPLGFPLGLDSEKHF